MQGKALCSMLQAFTEHDVDSLSSGTLQYSFRETAIMSKTVQAHQVVSRKCQNNVTKQYLDWKDTLSTEH